MGRRRRPSWSKAASRLSQRPGLVCARTDRSGSKLRTRPFDPIATKTYSRLADGPLFRQRNADPGSKGWLACVAISPINSRQQACSAVIERCLTSPSVTSISASTERGPERLCLRSLAGGVICAGSPTFWNRHWRKPLTCLHTINAGSGVRRSQTRPTRWLTMQTTPQPCWTQSGGSAFASLAYRSAVWSRSNWCCDIRTE
jgi:hypothetical protein